MSIPQALQAALAHHQTGQLQQAETLYRQVLAQDANQPDALHFLGLLAHQVGRNDLAVELMRRAIAIQPLPPHYHSNLANVYRALGRPGEAVECCRRAVALQPGYAEAYTNLGIALQEQGRCDEAIAAYRTSLSLKKPLAATHNNLGVALQAVKKLDEAEQHYRRALDLEPNYADACNNLASLRMLLGQMEEAVELCRRAVALCPENPILHGRLLYTLEFDPRIDAAGLRREKAEWEKRHARPLYGQIRPHLNDRDPDRTLRIAYSSPALRTHVVGRLMEALLAHHDHRKHQIIVYSDTRQPDAFTEKLKSYCDLWRETIGLNDEQFAEQVRQDRIDILVDLHLHMSQNRLLAFARKPAPVQVTYLGYASSTGLSAMDYRLTDRYLSPVASSQQSVVSSQHGNSLSTDYRLLTTGYSSEAPLVGQAPPYMEGPETLIYLPGCYWCYTAPPDAPEVSVLPALRNGHITFASFNHASKIHPGVVGTWAKVMQRVPASRMHLVVTGGQSNQHILDWFERHDVSHDRVKLIDHQESTGDYLRLYHDVDLGLDPFPYNGGVTTMDSLYMGVPVVTLAGERAVSRAGVTLLSNMDLPELIAQSDAQYIDIAAGLAADLPRLQQLRRTLRGRMRGSSIMDGAGFAQRVETAYREMWKAWVGM